MQNRPVIQLTLSKWDKILEVVAAILLLFLWISTFYIYTNAPTLVPAHFNAAGQADRYGGDASLWLLPCLGTFIYFLFTVLCRYPESFNYLRPITADNASIQYHIAINLLRLVKAAVMVVFIAIQWATFLTAKGKLAGLGSWFLPFTIGIIMFPVLFAIYRSLTNKS